MRVLIVGAGAIGQVFGVHFQRGGAEVSFLVRPKYAEAARAGFTLYRLNGSPDVPESFQGFGVESDQDEAMKKDWDLVVLALSSVAIRSGDWLHRLGASLGDAKLLSLVPETNGTDFLTGHMPPGRVAWGMLSVISYQAPLPHQTLPNPGIAFWFPPLSSLAFSGPEDVVSSFLPVLRNGGMPVKRVDSVEHEVALAGPILDKIIQSLECAGWSFETLRKDPELLTLAVQAMGESWDLANKVHGVRPPLPMRMLRPFMLRGVLWATPWFLSFDLERFFDFHYHKVGEQTLMHMGEQIESCEQNRVANPAMRALAQRIREGRGVVSTAP
ncbi:MAG: hypothetical protein GWP91_08340 [Rhodobacterales bacterium]|nr:hypothetical protein [Rhodobacterales bacterium]